MPEKSKIEFENKEPPERKTQYSFCQDEKFQSPFYQTPVLLLSPSHKWIRTNALYINPGNNAITSWIEAQVVNEAEAQAVFYASNMILMYFTHTKITQVFVLRRIKSSQDKYDP
ncbi:uncharacterized protein [Montipora foliosa]|uniref:uncharacterized protein isoform X1 n=1 Tax=Montipora foliosa TaxID=591990 RepID=UPI0035F1EC7B